MPKLPPEPDPERWDALARYLAGESSADEAAALRGWVAARPGHARLVAVLVRSLRRLAFRAPPDLDVEAALARTRARLGDPEERCS